MRLTAIVIAGGCWRRWPPAPAVADELQRDRREIRPDRRDDVRDLRRDRRELRRDGADR